jgi:RNA polymerase sigma-70 factor (ECF subfamily)
MSIAAVRTKERRQGVPADTEEVLPENIEELFREYYLLLYRSAYGVTGNRQDAEDVLQSLFVKLLQNGVPADLTHNPARYLHRAAVNLSLNVLRTRKRRSLVGGVEDLAIPVFDGPAAERQHQELHDRLMHALAQLRPRALEILLLHYKHDYTDVQIAEMLGTTRGTIAVTLFRIRARLRKLI